MRKFEWNALRLRDKVFVHDGVGTDFALIPGVVTAVEVRNRRHTVGIRVTTGNGPQRVLWPSSLTVHRDLGDDVGEPCWRCQAIADAAAAV
jgi:hypothetical protein